MSDLEETPPGLVSGIQGTGKGEKAVVAVFLSIALYNSIESVVLIFWTFREYSGLYFWSLLLSNLLGVIPSGVGSLLHFFAVGPLAVSLTVGYIGFAIMVPVQSLVLFSRLNLVYHSEKGLRCLFWVIIIVAVVLIIPTTVTTYGSALIRTDDWNYAFNVVERLQVTGFSTLEFFISSIYIFQTAKLLRLDPGNQNRKNMIKYELLAINVAINALDVAVLVIQYLNLYYIQICFKTFVYSVKLKLEFAVLSRLVLATNLPRIPVKRQEDKNKPQDFRPDFIDPAHALPDYTHAPTEGAQMQHTAGDVARWGAGGIVSGSDMESDAEGKEENSNST